MFPSRKTPAEGNSPSTLDASNFTPKMMKVIATK